MTAPSIHANALLVQGVGILIRGASKAGKSTLTVALIHEAQARGLSAILVEDDRIFLQAQNGQLIASGHPAIRGQLHVRDFGIVDMPSVASAPVQLVVDLVREKLASTAVSSRIILEGIGVERIKFTERSPLPDIIMFILEKIRQKLSEM